MIGDSFLINVRNKLQHIYNLVTYFTFIFHFTYLAQTVKRLSTMQETRV